MGEKKKAGKERRGEKKGEGTGGERREGKRRGKQSLVLTRDTLFLMPWDNVNE